MKQRIQLQRRTSAAFPLFTYPTGLRDNSHQIFILPLVVLLFQRQITISRSSLLILLNALAEILSYEMYLVIKAFVK